MSDVLQDVLTPGVARALSFGLPDLDAASGGLLPGRLAVVAAAPGAGGSLLAAAAARHSALTRGLPVLYAASGLTRTDVASRIVAAEAGADYRRLRAGMLSDHERVAVAEASARLAAVALHIDDGTGLSAQAIAETAPYIDNLALVVVDRLQRTGDPLVPLSGDTLPTAARTLARLARTLRLPVLAVLDTDDPHVVHTLDSDTVLTLTRDADRAQVTVAERDFGPLVSVALRADLPHARFADASGAQITSSTATSSSTAGLAEPATPAPAETELIGAALPFVSGACTGLPPRLTSALAALRDEAAERAGPAHVIDGRTGRYPGALPALRRALVELAARTAGLPDSAEGRRLAAALREFAVAYGPAAHRAPIVQTSPASGVAVPEAAEIEIADAIGSFAGVAHVGLSARAGAALHTSPTAGASGDTTAPLPAQATTAELAAKGVPLPATPEGVRLNACASGDDPAPATPDHSSEPAVALAPGSPADPAGPGQGAGGGARDYGYYLGMISTAVGRALEKAGGDVEAATAALMKKAIPDAMALFHATRVGATYAHTVYPDTLEFLRKKTQKTTDQVWEGRHQWRNPEIKAAVRNGTQNPLDITALDMNASFLSAFKTHLPIGRLEHDPQGGFDRKRSGIYRLTPPAWRHPYLPNPVGNRQEPGPVLLDDATVRLLIRCARLGLCEAPHITEAWTSGSTESLLEKFRRVLTAARKTAIITGDRVTEEYVKSMYSKFTSTIGESSANRDLRRPEWMHIIRSQAFANLWWKAHKIHAAGLTVVQVSGTDELHVAGDWKTIFSEGRMTDEVKEKRRYTIGTAS
ncbi:DnaB-like helicase C-terminal domain-containing protein [Streptomyces netropsis]|uniref:DnaB-like helicase C-terminal domain-containing protein n=1 Tax=Streptomyces netropsis TaxID=55404 RepID=UPI0030D62D5A